MKVHLKISFTQENKLTVLYVYKLQVYLMQRNLYILKPENYKINLSANLPVVRMCYVSNALEFNQN